MDVERAQELATRARGQANVRVGIVLLARSFHALADAGGLDPWHPGELYRWTLEHLHAESERHCARFILGLWNADDYADIDAENGGALGPFDAMRAVAAWDHGHRAAFAVWACDPWWP